MKKRLLVPIVVLAGAAVWGLGAEPATADCVAFEVYTYHQGDWGTRHYVPGGGPQRCVPFSDLGWPTATYTRAEFEKGMPQLPPGTPNGAGAAVWLTAP